MQRLEFAIALLLLLVPRAWSQSQAQVTGDTAPRTVQRNPHSTPADLAIPACPVRFDDSLATDGIANSKEEHAPKVVHSVAGEISRESRRALEKEHLQTSDSWVTVVVDRNGKPQSPCIAVAAGYGLDAAAAKAVLQYKFKPATKDDTLVPIRVTVGVNFRLY